MNLSVSTQCTQLASRLSNITTFTTGQKTIGIENAVWPPDDGRKDARNILKNNLLPIKLLTVAFSWSHLYLLIKDARSIEHRKERLGISWPDEWLRLWEVLYGSCYLRSKVFPVNGVKAYRGRRVIFPLILNLDTEWRWVVNLAPRLFALEKEPRGGCYLYVFI